MHTHLDEIQSSEISGPMSERLPVLPLLDSVAYPGLSLPVRIVNPKLQNFVDDAIAADMHIAVVAQRKRNGEEPGPGDCYDVGTTAKISRLLRQPDGSYQIIIQAGEKVCLKDSVVRNGYWDSRAEPIAESEQSGVEVDAMVLNLRTQFDRFVELAHLPGELTVTALNIDKPLRLAYTVASNLPLTIAERQTILEIPDVHTTLERVTFYLTRQLEKIELSREIQQRVKAGMDKRQREQFLREQLAAIRRELGESGEGDREVDELALRLSDLDLPEHARSAAEKELERLGRIHPASPEYTITRNYLDWILDLPWSASTKDNLDIRKAANILDEDHFDLEKVKRRILEFLAVLQLKREMRGPILCFVGPPGVGKTSLGQSIARSLGRKFLRISLGGLRDEAEIRGHRRTYVGSMPGRIIQGLRQVGSANPVFMLDEIDKLGMDFRGDPSSALLEVLDPEQNHTFSDHYLGVPFDLSKVMFIATANMLDPIPPALKDRLEVIEIAGYTEEEKLQIAKRYLVVRQIENHGLSPEQVSISDDAILEVIRSYTREAGVRNLNRNLASICRNIAKEIAEGRQGPVIVLSENLPEILGPVQFLPETATRSWGPGIATGLAWTPSGGELIFIETLRTNGSGRLILTGQLGEIMKESATAALTYLRARAAQLGIDEERFEKSDIHVHVPAGSIPKDGPSAGVTLLMALASLMSMREVRRDIAMTGEITLRGDILPVGGIKEKVLAARRAGIREVLIPHANAKDLVDIPEHLREGVVIREIQLTSEAFQFALMPKEPDNVV